MTHQNVQHIFLGSLRVSFVLGHDLDPNFQISFLRLLKRKTFSFKTNNRTTQQAMVLLLVYNVDMSNIHVCVLWKLVQQRHNVVSFYPLSLSPESFPQKPTSSFFKLHAK